MNTDFSDLGFTAYPNLIIPLNIARQDFLEIRAIFKADTSRCQHLEKVYWVISCGNYLFYKTQDMGTRHKTQDGQIQG